MLDIEIGLAARFGWSLYDIDRTDIESLLPFIRRLTKSSKPKARSAYADQLDL